MMSSHSTDFDPIGDEDWPPALEAMRGSFATSLNVYRVMAHHPALLAAWSTFRDHIVLQSSLDGASLEMTILRTGFRRSSHYEWQQHVVRGRQAGLSDKRIKSARLSPDQATCEQDALLIRCVDAIIDHDRLHADLQRGLVDRFGKEGVLDLMATVGMYSFLASMLNSFETPIDADIAAALQRAPLASPAV